MAKRSTSGVNIAAERRRITGLSMSEVAKEFTQADAEYRELTATIDARRATLELLREAMLSQLSAYGSVPGAASSRRARGSAGTAHGKGQSGRRRKGGSANGPRAGSLGSFIVEVMNDGQQRGVAEVIKGLKQTKHKSQGSAKSQAVMVSQALTKLTKIGLLAKLGRGVYVKKAS